MEVKATTRYARISPFKLRLPIAEVKGKNAGQALTLLKFMPLKAATLHHRFDKGIVMNGLIL